MPRKSTKKPGKAEENAQSQSENLVKPTASNALKESTMTGKGPETSSKRRGNSRERVADNDVKLQIRVSPRVAAILSEAAAARRCPLSNYCAILLSDIAFKEADAAPALTAKQEAEAAAIAAHMMGEE